MKKIFLFLGLLTISYYSNGQENYDNIDSFGAYKNNWALVQSEGLLGFIDEDGNQIVKPMYSRIEDDELNECVEKEGK